MSSETLTSYWTTSAVNSVALGTRLTSKSADRATLVRDLLNLVPMSDNNKPLQFLGCDTGPALRARLPLDRVDPAQGGGAFDSDVVEIQLAHDTQK